MNQLSQVTQTDLQAVRMQVLNGGFFHESSPEDVSKLMYFDSSYTQPCTTCCTQCAPNCCLATYY